MLNDAPSFTVVIPAAGVGKRMQANCPKQYLIINELTILEHTVYRLLKHPQISNVIIVLGKNDEYFSNTSLFNHPNVKIVVGGNERVDSVLAGLKSIDNNINPWVMVHDAARPCVTLGDITNLIETCITNNEGGLLASRAIDTMKKSESKLENKIAVETTVDRSVLWHAFTPQMYRTCQLIEAIEQGIENNLAITDESSAIEMLGLPSLLIEGRSDNIKITRKDDLAMARFILEQQQQQQQQQ